MFRRKRGTGTVTVDVHGKRFTLRPGDTLNVGTDLNFYPTPGQSARIEMSGNISVPVKIIKVG